MIKIFSAIYDFFSISFLGGFIILLSIEIKSELQNKLREGTPKLSGITKEMTKAPNPGKTYK